MRVELCQTKNGLPSFLALSMKSQELLTSISSTVVMSYFPFSEMGCMLGTFDMSGNGGSGPSSSIFCLPTSPQRGSLVESLLSVAQQWMKWRGPYVSRYFWSSGKEYQYGSDMA